MMRIDVLRAALATAILIGASRVHFAYEQLSPIVRFDGGVPFVALVGCTLNLILLLPFPLLLFLLYKYSVRPGVSAKQGYLALGIGVVLILSTIPFVRSLIATWRLVPAQYGDISGFTEAERMGHWLQLDWTHQLFWRGIEVLWQISLIVFTFLLEFAPEEPSIPEEHSAKVIRVVALMSMLASAIYLIWPLVWISLHSENVAHSLQIKGQTMSQFLTSTALSRVPQFCLLLIALIVYRGLRPALAATYAPPIPDTPGIPG